MASAGKPCRYSNLTHNLNLRLCYFSHLSVANSFVVIAGSQLASDTDVRFGGDRLHDEFFYTKFDKNILIQLLKVLVISFTRANSALYSTH